MLSTYDRDGVTVIELDRGPVNALDLSPLGALTAAFERADSPVVLTGAGGRRDDRVRVPVAVVLASEGVTGPQRLVRSPWFPGSGAPGER